MTRWQFTGYDSDDLAAEYIDAATGEAYYHRPGRLVNMEPAKKQPTEKTTALMTAPTPMAMIEKAIEGKADISVIERLMKLHEEWQANEARRDYDNAIALARAEIKPILKTRPAAFGSGKASYKYEDLADIAETVDPILAAHGLSYRWECAVEGPGVIVTCIVSHARGHREKTALPGKPDMSGNKNDMQALGSAVTYLQRYTLRAALGLATARDDDASAAAPPEVLTGDRLRALGELITEAQITPEQLLRRLAPTVAQYEVLRDALINHIEQRKAKNALGKLKEKRESEATLREQLRASVELEEAKSSPDADLPTAADVRGILKSTEPASNEIDVPKAYEMGMAAWHRNAQRDQWPASFKNQPKLIEAWQSGWDREEHAGGEAE